MILHKKTFYAMRHGQTTDNAAGLISGRGRDVSLTDQGREQAKAAAQIFENLSPAPSRIVVSALVRTHETANLATGNRPFHIDNRIDERHLGDLEGKITEVEQRLIGALPNEEHGKDHSARVLAALNHHLADTDTPMFVAHGGTLRRILKATDLKGKVEAHNAVIYIFTPTAEGWTVTAA